MSGVRVQQGSVCVLEQLESRIQMDGTDFSPAKPESFGNQLVHFTAQLSQKRSNINAVALGTKVFFPGGFVGYSKVYPSGQIPTNRIDIYDTATREWSRAKLSVARGVVAAVTVGNRVLFAGGLAMDAASQPVSSDRVDIYDATTRTWSTARLSQGRYAMSAVVVGDIAIFAGGNRGTSNGPLASDVVDLYNARTGRWTTAKLSSPRMYMGATAANESVFRRGLSSWSRSRTDHECRRCLRHCYRTMVQPSSIGMEETPRRPDRRGHRIIRPRRDTGTDFRTADRFLGRVQRSHRTMVVGHDLLPLRRRLGKSGEPWRLLRRQFHGAAQ